MSANQMSANETPPRAESLVLMEAWVRNPALRAHMRAVEAAVRAYAEKFGADPELWGAAGLLHDFDYERFPDPPDHPLKGSEVLKAEGYPEAVVNAILSHADYLADRFPRTSRLDHALYACDELCGFLVAVAKVRPAGFEGLKPKSVRKKMKSAGFAAAVPREDLLAGAAGLGVDFDEHVAFCIDALRPHAAALGLPGGDR